MQSLLCSIKYTALSTSTVQKIPIFAMLIIISKVRGYIDLVFNYKPESTYYNDERFRKEICY